MTALAFSTPAAASPAAPARRGGAGASAMLSALFAALLGSGLELEWGPEGVGVAGAALILAHVVAGGAFAALFAPWTLRHIRLATAKSQRRLFSVLGWALLVKYLVVLATGLVMALPPALWMVGQIWFWPMAATRLLAFLHLWLSLAAALGLILHLTLRHWRQS